MEHDTHAAHSYSEALTFSISKWLLDKVCTSSGNFLENELENSKLVHSNEFYFFKSYPIIAKALFNSDTISISTSPSSSFNYLFVRSLALITHFPFFHVFTMLMKSCTEILHAHFVHRDGSYERSLISVSLNITINKLFN